MSLPPTNFETVSYVQPSTPAAQTVAAGTIPAPLQPADSPSFAWGIIGGIAGAMLGAMVYVAFIEATHFRIGYLSIAVAYLVARGIMMGSRAQGGFEYQVTAVLLTCAAVAVGNAVVLYLAINKAKGMELTLHNLLVLLKYGALDPILRFESSGLSAIIGLVILFVGLRAAWRMTSGDPNAMHHPFAR